MLAVTLGHLESVRILLQFDTNVNCENSEGWTGKKKKHFYSFLLNNVININLINI